MNIFLPVVFSLWSEDSFILCGELYFRGVVGNGTIGFYCICIAVWAAYIISLNMLLSQLSTRNFSTAAYLVKLYLIFI